MVSCALVLFAARVARGDEGTNRSAAAERPSVESLPPLPALPRAPPASDGDDDEGANADAIDVEAADADDAPRFVDASDYDAVDDELDLQNVKLHHGHTKRAQRPTRQRGPKRHRPPKATARIPRSKPPHPPHRPKGPKAHRAPPPQAFGQMRMFFYKDQNVTRGEAHFQRDARPHDARPHDDGRARSGAAISASGTRAFGMDPIGDVLIGARLHLAAALPTLHQGSRWLSTGTIGLKGGIDLQTASAATAQLWHAGVAFGMGAPWSRDVIGVGIEGGILGGRYHDTRSEALVMSQNRTVPGPYAENIGPNAYGAASVTLQLPLRGNVRPFMSGDFGVTSRDDDKVATMAGLRGGLVWTAW